MRCLTVQLASRLQVNFLKRMPPSKRSGPGDKHLNDVDKLSEKDRKVQPAKLSEKTAKKLAKGSIAIEDGQIYDMSLSKAIYWTVWQRFWFAVFLNGLGSQYLDL